MSRAAASSFEPSVTDYETEEEPFDEVTMLPSLGMTKKRYGKIFTEGVPELADNMTGFASIPVSQTPSAQLSRPNTLTFNGTRYGMVFRKHLSLETLLSEMAEQEVSRFGRMFSRKK